MSPPPLPSSVRLPPAFVHLRVHTEFSIEDGITRINELITAASADGQVALGISDLSNLFGMVKHYKGCRTSGIKPVSGVDVWVTNDQDRDKPSRILLIVRHREGYRQLCELLSRSYLENQYRGRAEIRKEWLTAEATNGLICLSGAMLGDIGMALSAGNLPLARTLAEDWGKRFPDAFYVEIQRAGHPGSEAYLQQAVFLAGELDLPVVATHPIQFLHRDDFKAHEARVCIAQGYTLSDTRRPKHFTEEQYFKTQDEMLELFADLPEALENSVEIAKRCSLSIVLGKHSLPLFPTPEGMSLDDFLVQEAYHGLDERLQKLYPDPAVREKEYPRYKDRLEFELKTIIQMGFPGYFLIVADFIQWGKKNGVPIGPGRGSGAGSLVAYSLKITDLDPTAYALLFERFLNPERVSMPDFDVDFCQENRYRVIDYVRDRYGHDAVSQIATFGTMASKAVVRDVGRVLDLPYGLCDRLSKLIPVVQNKPMSLADAIEAEPTIREMMSDPNDGESISELWNLALPLEGMTRGVGMHAGGVLIAPGKITDFCPVYLADGEDASTVSQFDKDDVEQVGLVKFDFLGLRNLTIIDLALDYVERLTGERPDLMALGFEDHAAYQILKEANTTAIFQVESDGMKKLLKKLGPDRFEDIIAVLALYRPGPLGSGMVDDFILRKQGKQDIDYFHPDLKACLEPTYGVIVYQEQVMQISQIIGGYTLGGADMLRRAMGKKKAEEMAKHRSTIAEGAQKKGYDPALAEQLFDLMTKFAEYGFNKSHTAAYAVVTYHTAWLKVHHCASFMAATMSSDMDNTDSVKIFYEDTVANGVAILPPDVNASHYRFEPTDPKTIRYGLGAVKGCGEPAVRSIVEARKAGGAFKDLFDFCARVDRRAVNKRVIEALVRAGAFDTIAPKTPDGAPHRAKLMATVSDAMEAAEQAAASAGQGGLFDAPGEISEIAPEYVEAPVWNEKYQLAEEKTAIGFFLSGHPFHVSEAEVRRFVRTPLARIEPRREPQMLAGVVSAIRIKMGNRGKMAFVTLDDGTTPVDVTVYSEVLDASKGKITPDEVLIVEGKVSSDDYGGGSGLRVIAERLYTLGEARGRYARLLTLHINGEVAASGGPHAAVDRLLQMLNPHRGTRDEGGCPIRIRYKNRRAVADLPLGDGWRVKLDDPLLENLRQWLSSEGVEVIYQ
jgi:DNA polymerase III subunit alpha